MSQKKLNSPARATILRDFQNPEIVGKRRKKRNGNRKALCFPIKCIKNNMKIRMRRFVR